MAGVLAKINTYISGRVKGRRQLISSVIQYLHSLTLLNKLSYTVNFGIGTLDLLETSWSHNI